METYEAETSGQIGKRYISASYKEFAQHLLEARFQSCIEACAEYTVALKYIDRYRFLIGTPPLVNWEGFTVIPKG
jgi:hypothetical protein